MRQLTSLDAQFLALENARQSGHVAGVALLDPSTTPSGTLTVADIQALIAERLPLLPPLRWRLLEVPLGLDYPYWVDDSDFDLDFHVRELALPRPGSDAQLAEQVARITSRPLDRARPLWELYLIHGLHSGHVVMLTKIHHALIDGMSGAEIMGLLLDLGPDAPTLADDRRWRGEVDATPGSLEMLGRGLVGLPRYPLRMLSALPSALAYIEDTPFSTLPGASVVGALAGRARRLLGDESFSAGERLNAPRTSFNGRISPHRRFAFGRLSLDEVKQVKNAHGSTVNDVVVSICAGAVRRWLLEHDELPEESLVAQVPVSVRAHDQVGTYGNRILLMSAPLFTNEPDPVKRLGRTHAALADMKEHHRALPADLLQDANNFIPPAVFARAAQLTFRLSSSGAARPNWNLVISNVPGPQIPLYCAGARLEANFPVSVITDGMGLNITVMSYCGNLDFGIVADRDQMPDVWKLIDWLGDSLAELLAASGASARAAGNGAVKARPKARAKAKAGANAKANPKPRPKPKAKAKAKADAKPKPQAKPKAKPKPRAKATARAPG
ncbi:MAG TPA: wax ester/triacylglycerol synthase family O-acyltransferase [Solirubrobacteraceae bacterium]|nr:wax ester/triacylglycerol synthase family O-acyltransferase [Solirubrobacteraceae bacterium]